MQKTIGPRLKIGLLLSKAKGNVLRADSLAEPRFSEDITEIYADHFQEEGIQSAKTLLTEIANETELFSWIQSVPNGHQDASEGE